MSKLLIVSPGFHGYYAAVGRAFEELDYEVATHCYDVAASSMEKAWNKLRHELPAKVQGQAGHLSEETVSRRAAQRVREVAPDLVLVIRGDVLTEEFWAEAAAGGRHVVVWMYDEIRRTAFDADLVGHYARMATYSKHDTDDLRSAGHEALHVPLGFDASVPSVDSQAGLGVFSFVGAPFDKRIEALRALLAAGLPVQAWGRGWSDHLVDRARTWRTKSVGIPADRDVPGPVTHAIMRNSLGTLNIHGDQDGFTMRTFEAAGVGAVQFVDRPDVAEFYVPGEEVLVFDSHECLIEQARKVLAEPTAYAALRERAQARTLAEHTLTHRAGALSQLW